VTAADIVYGRRGAGWVSHHPGRLLAEVQAITAQARAEGWQPPDLSRLFHPDTVAATRAHQRNCGGRTHLAGETCPAQPDPDDVAGIWAGWARMAAARRAAGVPLDDLDRQALARLARLDDPGADPR
jgi:hypothetical protein